MIGTIGTRDRPIPGNADSIAPRQCMFSKLGDVRRNRWNAALRAGVRSPWNVQHGS
jgi:hypothetical protein